MQADLTDAGDAFAVVRGHDAVIHAAAIPEPTRNPPHTVFHNNLMGVFNTLEAAIRFGVPRFVNVSSETVPGFFFPERPFLPDYAPVDEEHPIRPQDPYATAKYFSELLMDAAMRRSDIRCLTIRPTWVQWEGNYERNLGPVAARSRGRRRARRCWAYIDVYDLADALRLAAESDLDTHEVFYIASPDNSANRPLADLDPPPPRRRDRDPRAPPPPRRLRACRSRRPQRLLGYAPTRSWRDYLAEDGTLLDAARERARARRHRRSARARGGLGSVAAAIVGWPSACRRAVGSTRAAA